MKVDLAYRARRRSGEGGVTVLPESGRRGSTLWSYAQMERDGMARVLAAVLLGRRRK